MSEWVHTDSEAIDGYRYDETRGVLRVRFHSGTVYDYLGATDGLVRRLDRASSKGQFFTRHIRDKLAFTRMK